MTDWNPNLVEQQKVWPSPRIRSLFGNVYLSTSTLFNYYSMIT